jgi:hypothetical protein
MVALIYFLHHEKRCQAESRRKESCDPKETSGGWQKMGRQVAVVLYVVAMAAVIVGVDFVFFRNRFWERLTVNIGIVLVFAAFYWRFLRRP